MRSSISRPHLRLNLGLEKSNQESKLISPSSLIDLGFSETPSEKKVNINKDKRKSSDIQKQYRPTLGHVEPEEIELAERRFEIRKLQKIFTEAADDYVGGEKTPESRSTVHGLRVIGIHDIEGQSSKSNHGPMSYRLDDILK